MRRIAGAILMVACAICFVGATASPLLGSQRLGAPRFVFLGMGVNQFARAGEDDPAEFGSRPSPGEKQRAPEE